MRFSLELPAGADGPDIAALAQAAETAGFAQLGFTDHPAPTAAWRERGGHATLDPFAALCFIAAVTREVRLMTYLAVLPYRNPLLLAKSVATVDHLSGGRFTLVAGTGYLRSEFAAVGRPFEERNRRFEEAIDVLRHVYVDDDYRCEGSDFRALGVIHDPKPVQLPHPPIWIGGSSPTSRRRVARYGDGWAPLAVPEEAASVVRTTAMATDDDLRAGIDDLRALVTAENRDPASISVQLDGALFMEWPADRVLGRAEELAAIGVTHGLLRPPARGAAEAIERFGTDVISRS
jgi:probable F420-dependent oxidoreductase